MKNIGLKKYLNTFRNDADVSFLLANPRKRKIYPIEQVDFITDMGQPVFCVTVGEPKDMDTELIAVCEDDERNIELRYREETGSSDYRQHYINRFMRRR